MVKHIVMFKFTGTEEQRKEVANGFKASLLALNGKIEALQAIEVGININPAEKWDLVLTAQVATFADVEKYAKHPLHVQAVQSVKPSIESRACVDYEA